MSGKWGEDSWIEAMFMPRFNVDGKQIRISPFYQFCFVRNAVYGEWFAGNCLTCHEIRTKRSACIPPTSYLSWKQRLIASSNARHSDHSSNSEVRDHCARVAGIDLYGLCHTGRDTSRLRLTTTVTLSAMHRIVFSGDRPNACSNVGWRKPSPFVP